MAFRSRTEPPSSQVADTIPGEPGGEVTVGGEGGSRGRTLRTDAWRRLRRNKLAMVGFVWIVFVALVAISADLWVPQTLGDPVYIPDNTAEASLQPPSWDHPFGTDKFGRDILSRVIYGARVSLLIGVLAVTVMVTLGMILGALAAYNGGIWDSIIMRLADTFYAFPFVLFAVALLAVFGPSWTNVFLAIGIVGWPGIARVFRSSIFTVKENEYVDAARSLGASGGRILVRHIMPNAMAPIIVFGTMSIGGAILAEAALSYLGMGVQLPDPSWGNMIDEGRAYMTTKPWLMIFPGIACLTTVLGFVLLGDGLRDAFDVKMKE